MRENLINMTKKMISIDSVSANTNLELIELIEEFLTPLNFSHERSIYKDPKGIKKYNLISHRGESVGGLVFLIHSDTVPLADTNQLIPEIIDGRLYGRGACDMKGPATASLYAIKNAINTDLPITVIVTSDEEIGCEGAEFVVNNSKLLQKIKPLWGITTEPTELKPVYAHKGLGQIIITAEGKAAHSSTAIGDSANFKMAPFLYFISKLKDKYNIDDTYQNTEFDPPTNTLNMTISDFNCALNVTAAKSRCKICFRAMPHARTEDVVNEIVTEAKRLNMETSHILHDALYISPESEIVVKAEKITGKKAETVAYLTDASQFSPNFKSIILGPGSIDQAHTKDEYINIDELEKGYHIYKELIESFHKSYFNWKVLKGFSFFNNKTQPSIPLF